ncbi:MAG: ATP-binding protein [bacterium]|nr:ATP-binding protein [bacterium]
MKFVNRFTEKRVLADLVGRGSVIVFGRRRVGKTALIRESLGSSNGHIFYQAVKLPAPVLYRELGILVGEYTGSTALKSGEITDINVILEIFAEQCGGKTLVLDEFGYMVESDPALPSVLQRFWDKHKGKCGLFLTGSTYSIIESLLGERSPLWGRIDAALEIKPLSYIYTADFWEELSFEYRAGLYGALGGIPYNWERAKIKEDFFDTLLGTFFLHGSPLYQEVFYILREELREIKVYMAVLQSIASGRHRYSEIADFSGVPIGSLSKYLDILKGMSIVMQEVPVGEKANTRKGLWKINDPMFRFWFKYVLPYRHMIEIEAGGRVIPLVKEGWNNYMGGIYEDIAGQLVGEMIKAGELPFVEKLGRWWNKEMEFDIVGLNNKKVCILGEVKWGYFSPGDLKKFQKKIEKIPFELDSDVRFVLFSGKGFRVELPEGYMGITGDR